MAHACADHGPPAAGGGPRLRLRLPWEVGGAGLRGQGGGGGAGWGECCVLRPQPPWARAGPTAAPPPRHLPSTLPHQERGPLQPLRHTHEGGVLCPPAQGHADQQLSFAAQSRQSWQHPAPQACALLRRGDTPPGRQCLGALRPLLTPPHATPSTLRHCSWLTSRRAVLSLGTPGLTPRPAHRPARLGRGLAPCLTRDHTRPLTPARTRAVPAPGCVLSHLSRPGRGARGRREPMSTSAAAGRAACLHTRRCPPRAWPPGTGALGGACPSPQHGRVWGSLKLQTQQRATHTEGFLTARIASVGRMTVAGAGDGILLTNEKGLKH